MALTKKARNVLLQAAQVWIPAAGTLYFALAQIWHIPHPEDVVGSITALDAFLGTALHISAPSAPVLSIVPSDGKLVVDKSNPAKDVYSLELTTPPEDLAEKDAITLDVRTVADIPAQ